jgi:hypothetical protein
MNTISQKSRKFVRDSLDLDRNFHPPVIVKTGNKSPQLVGQKWHYETKGGRKIYHPTSYSRTGWSNMIYVPSTIRIEVGEIWLRKNGISYNPLIEPAKKNFGPKATCLEKL